MFFKRERKDKPKVAEQVTEAPAQPPRERSEQRSQNGSVHVPLTRPTAMSASDLRRATKPETLGFKTTAELEPPVALLGQDETLRAIAVGASVMTRGHNVVVTGANSLADVSAIRAQIQAIAAKRPPPSDWVYVANFADAQSPQALQLPAGLGRVLASSVNNAIGEIRSAILSTLGGDSYQTRWRAIDAEFQARHQAGLEALARTADAHSIALLRTPMGYAVAPAHDGSVVLQETFANMPPTMQADVRAHITALEADLSDLLEKAPQVDRQRRARLTKLNGEVLASIVRTALAEPRQSFADHKDVLDYFSALEADIVANANDFMATIDLADILDAEPLKTVDESRFDRYRVNVFVSWAADANAAPVVQEPAPNPASLFGGETSRATADAAHMRLVAGALHYANGGFLLLDARALTASPQAWSGLLAALQAGAVCSALAGDSTLSSSPAPTIPLDVKIVLLSDSDHLRRELSADPRFADLFKVQVAFADAIARTPESERAMARAIAGMIAQEGIEPLEAGAVAELIELSARTAGDRDLLSLAISEFAGILRQADARRGAASRKLVSRDDIADAGKARQSRALSAPSALPIADPIVGSVTVLCGRLDKDTGPRVQRATARIHPALIRPETIDVERLGRASGATAARKVAAYLAAEFGHRQNIALAASIGSDPASEQSTSGEETCAEMIALLSAIAEWPLPQSIAVAGSFDQFGNVCAVGVVDAAIEEFFDVCRASGIKSEAGVVIPAACLSRMMLRKDIVDAVAAGEFAVWSAATLAECVAIVTGLSAGHRRADGSFAQDDAYRRIDERLQTLNEQARLRQLAGKEQQP